MTKREKKQLRSAILGIMFFTAMWSGIFVLALIKAGIYVVG